MKKKWFKCIRWRVIATAICGEHGEARYYLYKSENVAQVTNRYKVVFVPTDKNSTNKKRSRYYKAEPTSRAFEFYGW